MLLTRNLKHKSKTFFFVADIKTSRVFWGFKQLSSAIVGGDIPVQKHVETAGFSLRPLETKVLNFACAVLLIKYVFFVIDYCITSNCKTKAYWNEQVDMCDTLHFWMTVFDSYTAPTSPHWLSFFKNIDFYTWAKWQGDVHGLYLLQYV